MSKRVDKQIKYKQDRIKTADSISYMYAYALLFIKHKYSFEVSVIQYILWNIDTFCDAAIFLIK